MSLDCVSIEVSQYMSTLVLRCKKKRFIDWESVAWTTRSTAHGLSRLALNDHQLKLVGSKAFGGLNRRLKEKTAESRWFETTGQAPFGRAKAAY